jgi:hypothetical protein
MFDFPEDARRIAPARLVCWCCHGVLVRRCAPCCPLRKGDRCGNQSRESLALVTLAAHFGQVGNPLWSSIDGSQQRKCPLIPQAIPPLIAA